MLPKTILFEQTKRRYVDPYLLAAVHIGLGEKEQTLAELEKAYHYRSGWMPWLKNVRGSGPFQLHFAPLIDEGSQREASKEVYRELKPS